MSMHQYISRRQCATRHIQLVWVCAVVVEIRPAISAAVERANDFISADYVAM